MEKLPFLLNQIKSDIEIARKDLNEEHPCETIKETFTIIEKLTRALELEVEDYKASVNQMCEMLNITLPVIEELDDEEEYSEDVQVEDEEDKRAIMEEAVEAEQEEEL